MIIARHGSLEDTPENTFAAFEQALNIGVDGLEVDVRKTKDDRLILMHDDTIDRTTDGKGYVNKLLYDEIRLYDAGAWKGEKFAGERVPLLSDVLQFAKKRNIKIILNVKEHGIELKTLSLIEKVDMINQIYFSGRLDNVRSKDIGIQGTQLVFIPPNEITNEVIDFFHERHKHVGTSLFNTDDRDRIKEGMVEGVDVILTDYPSVAIDILHYRTKNEAEYIVSRKGLEPDIEGNTGQIEGIIDAIVQGSPDRSRMAAFVLSTLPQEISIPPLIELLTYKKSLKRFNPFKKIMSALKREEKEEGDNLLSAGLVKRNTAWALGLTGNRSAVNPLITHLEDADSELKREIILALKMIGDKQAVPALNKILLNDENPFIRYDAARALGNIASTDSIFTLIKALKTDKNWMVKGACATALGKTGNKKAVNELKSILNIDAGYEASWARDRAACALAGIGEGGIEALVSSLGASRQSARRRASWALIEIGDPAVPYLISALKDLSSFARKRAAMVLGWIGNKEAVVPLSWALADNNLEVRKMAVWALGRIGETKAIAALKQTLDDQNKKEEKINNQMVNLNDQLKNNESSIFTLVKTIQSLGNHTFVSDNKKTRKKTSKVNIQNEFAELLRVVAAQKEKRKDKINASIERLMKKLRQNKDVTEYAEEAMQRIN